MNRPSWIKIGARLLHKESKVTAKIISFTNEGNPVIEFDDDGAVYDDYSLAETISKFEPIPEAS